MATQISIDIETLGTTTGSQILSIGACSFNAKGDILDKFYGVVDFNDNYEVVATVGTLKFWIGQPEEAVSVIFNSKDKMPEFQLLSELSNWIKAKKQPEIWANGTKFDLGMLEETYRKHKKVAPWSFNADRCMRTLRKFAGSLDVDYEGLSHYALDDAIWQAKYIALACKKLGLKL